MKTLMTKEQFEAALTKLANAIAEQEPNMNDVGFVGIHTRGVPLAKRFVEHFAKNDIKVLEGILDINLYRDDLSQSSDHPVVRETKVPFDVNGKTIYLCDDVLYTGRTIRAAMDALFDLGRPKKIHLVVWAKRNGRELPIDTDLAALNVKTKDSDNIKVKFLETDGKDEVVILEEGEY